MSIKHNILILDDDRDFRENLFGILRDEGYAPVTIVTGKEAMERVREDEFAVALIDLKLEDISGIDVMKGIKEYSPMTEGIFITGYASKASAIEAVNLAAYSYVEKPFNVRQLLTTIRMAVEKWEVGKVLRETRERYRSLFEGSGDAIYISTSDDQFVEFNQASLDLFGYTRAEIMSIKPSEIYLNPDDLRSLKEEIKQKGYVKDREVKFRKSDGKQIICIITSTGRLLKDKGVWEYQAIVRDITEKKLKQRRLQETLETSRRTLNGFIQCVARMIEKRDPYIAGHQQRVTDLAGAIAQEMGLPENQRDAIRMAAIIHDIGKISVPSEILNKSGPLTEIEFSLLKTHSRTGYDILKEIEWPYPVAEIVLQHHERMDGSGYPQGLSGKEILLEARILGVADVVEAMASHRPYRPALGIDKALEEIRQNREILYDPQVVDACLRFFVTKGFKWDQSDSITT